jgi:hypothetical protein
MPPRDAAKTTGADADTEVRVVLLDDVTVANEGTHDVRVLRPETDDDGNPVEVSLPKSVADRLIRTGAARKAK